MLLLLGFSTAVSVIWLTRQLARWEFFTLVLALRHCRSFELRSTEAIPVSSEASPGALTSNQRETNSEAAARR
jgi:hypothetical protein